MNINKKRMRHEIIKDLLRRLTKDESVTFTEHTRAKDRKLADELVSVANKAGYNAVRRSIALGYIVFIA